VSKLLQGVLWALMGAAISGGVFILLHQPQRADITILLPTPTVAGPATVYVTGAVASPGLYTLPPGSRVDDALSAAGGALPDADLAQVNLARLVRDGEQVHVLTQGQPALPSASTAVPATGALVNLSTAGLDELMTLPGIGQVKAQAILDYRQQNGPFQRIDDLLRVPGIGPTTLQQIQGLVTLGG